MTPDLTAAVNGIVQSFGSDRTRLMDMVIVVQQQFGHQQGTNLLKTGLNEQNATS